MISRILARTFAWPTFGALVAAALVACSSGPSAEEHLARAEALRAQGDRSAAIIELKNALQKSPDLAQARWLLGRTYVEEDNGKGALKELTRARELGINTPELAIARARALMLTGNNEEALVELAGVDPEHDKARVLALTGQAQLGLRRLDRALAAFEQALELDPKQADARLGLAMLAASRNDLEEADRHIAVVLEHFPNNVRASLMKGELDLARGKTEDAELAFKGALTHGGDRDLTAHLGLARALFAQNRMDEALEHLEAIRKYVPEHPVANYLVAAVHYQRQELQEAQEVLREVLRVSPDHLPSMLLMGTLNYAQGQYEQAEEHLSRYSKAVPGHIPARKLLAAVRMARRQPDRAAEVLEPVADRAADDPQFLALLGSAYLRSGQTDKASEYLSRANELAPDVAAIRTQLAVSHLAMGATDAAISELESAVDLGQGLVQADVLLVVTHLQSGDFDKALAAARKLAEREPDNAMAYNMMGAAHLGKGEVDKARTQFEAAMEAQPQFTPALLNLAQIDLRQEDTQSATRRLEQVLEIQPGNEKALVLLARLAGKQGDDPKAVELLERARRDNPDAAQPRLLLGTYYLGNGRLEEAVEVTGELEAIAGQSSAVKLLRARVGMRTGRAQESAALLSDLLEDNPDSPALWSQLGTARYQSGQVDEARTAFEKALELTDGKDPAALMGLGRLELATGRYQEARHLASRLTEHYPESSAGALLRGDVLTAQGQQHDAVSAYEQALEQVPTSEIVVKLYTARMRSGAEDQGVATLRQWLDSHPEDNTVRMALASHNQSRGLAPNAAADYEQILQRDPDNAVALNNLAWIYHEQAREGALKLAERALQAAPQSAAIMDTVGWLRVQHGQVEQGLRLLEQAAEQIPGSGDVRYHLAVALSKTGEKERARRELEAALQQGAQFPARAQAEALLAELGGA